MYTNEIKRTKFKALIIVCLAILCLAVSLGAANFFVPVSAQVVEQECEAADDAVALRRFSGGKDGNIVDLENTNIANFTNVKYIPNNNYFLTNPRHVPSNTYDNPVGTCTTTAVQMLMGYHNYFTDRRLIPKTAASGTRFLHNDYGKITGHPQFDRGMVSASTTLVYAANGITPLKRSVGCTQIGTHHNFYQEIFNLTTNAGNGGWPQGQAYNNVAAGARKFVNTHTPSAIRANVSITDGGFSSSTAIADIDAGKPIVLVFNGVGPEKSYHVVPAYGYAALDGVQGFIVHCGWGTDKAHAWVPADWIGWQIRMSVTHTHSFTDAGNIINDTHREVHCSTCGYKNVVKLYNTTNIGDNEVRISSVASLNGTLFNLTGNIVIPSEFRRQESSASSEFKIRTVTQISGYSFTNQTQISKITIPKGVTSIGSNAFPQNIHIVLTEDRTQIQAGLFQDQTQVSQITIPVGVTSIGVNAFFNTGIWNSAPNNSIIYAGNWAIGYKGTPGASLSLRSDTRGIADHAFYNCTALKYINLDSVANIGEYAFYNTNLQNINLPNFVKISGNAFVNNKNIQSAVITTNAGNMLPGFAFNGCNINNLELTGFSSIDSNALNNCTVQNLSLTRISYIASSAFSGMTGLTSLKVVEGGWENYSQLMDLSNLTSLSLNGVYIFSSGAFSNCNKLESIEFVGDTVTLKDGVFSNCKNLTTLNINSSVSFNGNPFAGCTKLDRIYVNYNGGSVINNLLFPGLSEIYVNASRLSAYRTVYGNNKVFAIADIHSNDFSNGMITSGSNSSLYLAENNGKLVLPYQMPGGEKIIVIGSNAFRYRADILSAVIPNSVKVISNYAFSGSKLTSIKLSNSLQTIDIYAFYLCSDLTQAELHEGLKLIASCAFAESGLQSIVIPSTVQTIESFAFFKNNITDLTIVTSNSALTYIGSYAFSYNNFTSFELPSSVNFIGDYAFAYCAQLKTASLKTANITKIPVSMFNGCVLLEKAVLPDTVTRIENYAFQGCNKLQDFRMPASLQYIGDKSFQYCKSLEELHITATQIGGFAFEGCMGLKGVYLYNNASLSSAFNGLGCVVYTKTHANPLYRIADITNTNMTGSVLANFNNVTASYLIIPGIVNGVYVTEISSKAGRYNSIITGLVIPRTLGYIDDLAFANCDNLESVWIKDSKTYLGTEVFYYCGNLATVKLPDDYTWIGIRIFVGCTSLTSIELPSSLETIGTGLFCGSGLVSLTIPEKVSLVEFGAFADMLSLTELSFLRDAAQYGNITEQYLAFLWQSPSITVNVPANNLPQYTAAWPFSNCTVKEFTPMRYIVYNVSNNQASITGVTAQAAGRVIIPAQINGAPVVSIAGYAFNNNNAVTYIYLPDSIKSIGNYAFSGCTNLAEIRLPDNPLFVTINVGVFLNCTALTSIDIPGGITVIDNYAFQGSGLLSITVSGNITTIGIKAFADCGDLQWADIGGSVENIYGYAFENCFSLAEFTLNRRIGSGLTVIDYGIFQSTTQKITLRAYSDSMDSYYAALTTGTNHWIEKGSYLD